MLHLDTRRLPPRARMTGVLMLATLITAQSVHAEVRVEGNARTIRIEANQAPVAEVLTALGNTSIVHVRTIEPMDGTIDGVFTGPLEQVLSKLLAEYNYVLRKGRNSVELLIIGARGTRAIYNAPIRAPVHEGLAKQWRTPNNAAAGQKP